MGFFFDVFFFGIVSFEFCVVFFLIYYLFVVVICFVCVWVIKLYGIIEVEYYVFFDL